MDSLLSIVQMPAGVPVGTLAIGRAGAVNAGLLAAAILALATTPAPGWRGLAAAARATTKPRRVRDQREPHRSGMTFPLPPNATIGLVGGGQLGRMSALAAARLGYRCHILTREVDSPAAQVAHAVTISDYADPVSLRAFAAAVDVISFEFENVSAEGLDLAGLAEAGAAGAGGAADQPGPGGGEDASSTAPASPTAPWLPVGSLAELHAAAAQLGLPAVLKTTRLGYDGKGQRTLRAAADLADAFAALEPKPLILEGFVDFACEISVVVARGADGAMSAFDTVENRHRDHILDLTLAPARIAEGVAAAAQAIARRVAAGAGPGRACWRWRCSSIRAAGCW